MLFICSIYNINHYIEYYPPLNFTDDSRLKTLKVTVAFYEYETKTGMGKFSLDIKIIRIV